METKGKEWSSCTAQSIELVADSAPDRNSMSTKCKFYFLLLTNVCSTWSCASVAARVPAKIPWLGSEGPARGGGLVTAAGVVHTVAHHLKWAVYIPADLLETGPIYLVLFTPSYREVKG